MAAVSSICVRVTTNQARTGATSYADVSGATIPVAASGDWGGFVTGGEYLILIRASVAHSSSNGVGRCRVAAGGVALAESERSFEPSNSEGTTAALANRVSYFFPILYTVPATPVAITLQSATDSAGNTTWVDHVVMWAARLDDMLTSGTDYAQAENGTDTDLATSFGNFASMTFTPGVASNIWALFHYVQIDTGSAITTNYQTRGSLSGGTTATWAPTIEEPGDLLQIGTHGYARAISLPASSHTFAAQAMESSTSAHTHLFSRVIRLNLSKFTDVSQIFTASMVAYSATAWASAVQALTHTKTVDGKILVFTSCVDNWDSLGEAARHRLQVDNVDRPAGGTEQTTAAYNYQHTLNDATDQNIFTMFDEVSITANAQLDHDGHATVTSVDYLDRSLFAFSMDVAGSGGGVLNAAVAFVGDGNFAPSARRVASGAASWVGDGNFAPAARRLAQGAVAFVGDGNLAPSAVRVAQASTVHTATGTFTASAVNRAAASVSFIGNGTFTPAGRRIAQGAVSYLAEGTFAASPRLLAVAGASFVGDGNFAASGTTQATVNGAVAFVGDGTFSAAAIIWAPQLGAVSFVGDGNFAPAATRIAAGQAAFTGSATFAASGALDVRGAVSYVANGTFLPTPSLTALARAVFSGEATFSPRGNVGILVERKLSGTPRTGPSMSGTTRTGTRFSGTPHR